MRASNYSRARNLAAVFQRRRWFPERSKPKPEPPFVPPTPLPKVRSPQCRAVHFCDLYLAETYWYYQKRLRWEVFVSQPPVVESWGNVCDDKLPEPWTCNWDVWGLADCWSKETVPQLFARFGLAVQKPLTFRSTYNEQTATAFLGVEKPLENPMFYLYDDPTKDVFRFEGDVDGKAPVGAAEFLDTANWNKMTHLGSLTNPDAILRHRHIPEPPLIARNDHETPWGWEPREIRSPDEVRAYKENPAIRDWISISNKDLPSPWTCLWTYYSWNKTWRADLWQSYGLGTANPIMWHRGHQCRKTLLLESGGIFYLYDKGDEGWHEWFKKEDTFNSPLPLELLYRFDGEFSSVADFIERADWTRMSILAPRERGNELAPEENKQRHNVKLPLACDGGKLQILPPTSYRKQTMWDLYRPPGTWGYEPRQELTRHPWSLPDAAREWGALPDEELPEPWSCDWTKWTYTTFWSDPPQSSPDPDSPEPFEQLLLQRMYGVPPLTPAMYRWPQTTYFSCMVLCAEGTYYMQLNKQLWKFDGTYASVADFVENADWNKMEKMVCSVFSYKDEDGIDEEDEE